MGCGCDNACGCNVVGDEITAHVQRSGDTFTVSAIPVIAGIEDTDTVDLSLDPLKILRAVARLAASDAIELVSSSAGIVAQLRIDPASTAPVSITSNGLLVNAPDPTVGGGALEPGDIVDYAGIRVPAGRVECYGQPLQTAAYPEAYDALTLYGLTASTTEATAQVTGLDTTLYIEPGMILTGSGFSGPVVVVSVDSANSVTVDQPANYTTVGTAEIRVFVWGYYTSDPTFFVAPDLRDAVVAGLSNMGASPLPGADATSRILGGLVAGNDATLGAANLPLHDHVATVTDNGHTHVAASPPHSHTGSADSGGGHTHGVGPGRSFVTTDTLTPTTVSIANDSPEDIFLSVTSIADPAQTNNQATAPGGTHGHALSIAGATVGVNVLDAFAVITVDVLPAGSSSPTPIDVRQRTVYMRKLMVV